MSAVTDMQAEAPRSLSSNVRSGAIWNVASTMLVRISSIGVTAMIARILNAHDFGVFAVAATAFAIVTAFGEFGVTSCLARADLEVDALAPTLWTVSLGSSFLMAAVLELFAQPIATSLGSREAAGPIRVMSILMVLWGVAAVPTAQCVRDFKQDKIFLANVLSFIPSTSVVLLLAAHGSGAMAFAWSRVAGQVVSCAVILCSAPRLHMPGLRRNALSVLYRYGLPLACANFVGYILQNVDYVLIGRLMGSILLGIYVLAFNVASWSSTLLGSVLGTVAMPAFSRVRHDAAHLVSAIADGVRAVMLISAPVCMLVMMLARPIVLTLYGAKWAAAASVLSILSLYGLIAVMCLLSSSVLAALGRSRSVLGVQLLWLAGLVPAMAIGVHDDGIVGAAIAHVVIVGLLVFPCYLIALKRATGVRIGLLVRAALPPLMAAVAAAGLAWLAASRLHRPPADLIIGSAVGGLCYLVFTAPQLLHLAGSSWEALPSVQRVLRIYSGAGTMLRITERPAPRHARNDRKKFVPHDKEDTAGPSAQFLKNMTACDFPESILWGANMTVSRNADLVGQLLADRPAFHLQGAARWNATTGTLNAVHRLVRPGDRTLEVGAGLTTVVFAAAGARHTAVSPDPAEHQLIREYCRKIGVDYSQLEFLVGLSDEILPSYLTRERTLDVAFVDGAHSFPLPIVDWHYVSRAVKVAGKLLIDDIPIPAVRPAFEHMRLESAWRLDGIFDNRCAAFTLMKEPDPGFEWLNQPFNNRYPDYGFVGGPRRLLLRTEYRARLLRRALGRRFPELRRRYRSRIGPE